MCVLVSYQIDSLPYLLAERLHGWGDNTLGFHAYLLHYCRSNMQKPRNYNELSVKISSGFRRRRDLLAEESAKISWELFRCPNLALEIEANR